MRPGAILAYAAALLVLAAPVPRAEILGVTNLDGVPGRIVPPPGQALDHAVASDTHMLGFNERQDVLLKNDLAVDGGVIPAGTRVSSHLILLNVSDGAWSTFGENEWMFSVPVIGVMSDVDGTLEAQSTPLLGAPGTDYPRDGYYLRGMEDNDGYRGVGTTRLRVSFFVWQPGDWIRVITAPAPVASARPVPQPTRIADISRGILDGL